MQKDVEALIHDAVSDRRCMVADCKRPYYCKGVCAAHWQKLRRLGDVNAGRTFERHGDRNSPEYKAWCEMRARCSLETNAGFKYYGARGISVCRRWDESYLNFLADIGRRPSSSYSLDRRDNSGDYCPENCRWATKSEQARNRRSNTWIYVNGERMLLCEASYVLGVKRTTLSQRLRTKGTDHY